MGNDNKKGSYLVGARALSINEIEKVLPTYEKIFSDIEIIRESFELSDIKDSEKIIRRTNSIGIMGKRGTGKTSILHSIRNRLSKEQDIILDIIVPDNMSEKSDLLGNIIGRFNSEIDELEKKAKSSEGKENKLQSSLYDSITCRFKKDNVLREAYKKMVTAYCYMQPEYRDLLIRNYTDLPSYISKSGEVFNADTEFIKRFNDFIYQLVKVKMEQNGNQKALIHIFIDDIDLAPHRCPQIAKALLAYLAHPAIVVHLSGDIETFEEALTLRFLTQNDAIIPADILTEKFVESKSLLDRKKELAYDYMKKIIPANYRHSLRYWELKSRAEYSINTNEGESDLGKTLKELLVEVLEDESVERLFTCFTYKDDKIVDRKGTLAVGYHIFDERSRGLNNVYSSLLQMKQVKEEIKQMKEKDATSISNKLYVSKKLLIDTIISANPYLNSNRDKIEKIILWGDTEELTNIRVDNLLEQMESTTTITKIIDSNEVIRKFALFELVYLTICIMPKVQYDKLVLEESKKICLFILLVSPILNDSTLKLEPSVILRWGRQLKIEIKDDRDEKIIEDEKKNSEKIDEDSWREKQWIAYINGFVLNSEFSFALHYYQEVVQNIGYMINKGANEQYVIAFINSLMAYAGESSEGLLTDWREDDNKRNLLDEMYRIVSTGEENMMYKFLLGALEEKISTIFCEYTKEVFKDSNNKFIKWYESSNILAKRQKCEDYNKIIEKGGIVVDYRGKGCVMEYGEIYSIIYPSILRGFEGILKNEIEDINHITIDVIKKELDKDTKKDSITLLLKCAEQNMWDKVWTEDLISNNINQVNILLEKALFNGKGKNKKLRERGIMFKIQEVLKLTMINFLKHYYGISWTVADETVFEIKKILGISEINQEIVEEKLTNISLNQYLEIMLWIKELAGNSRVRYGRRQANEILNELTKVEIEFNFDEEEEKDVKEEMGQRLLCYIIYLKQTRKDIDDLSMIIHNLIRFSGKLEKSEQTSDENVTHAIKSLLGKDDINMTEIFGGSGELNEAIN